MNEPRATRYQRLRRRAHAGAVASGAAMLAAVALTPFGSWLATSATAYGRGLSPPSHAVLSLLVFVVCLVLLWEIAVLPAMLVLALKIDRRYGAQPAGVEDVIAAQAQTTLLVVPAALTAAGIVQMAAWSTGGAWWAVAGALLAAAMVAALHGAPRVVARLTGAQPLAAGDLSLRLARLALQAGVPIAGIDVVAGDTGRLTALVTGAGRSRRVFLSAELAGQWSIDEIAVVVAHELAHHAHHDLWRTLALDAVVLSIGLWVADVLLSSTGAQSARDLAALPFVALVAGAVWLAATPIRHAYSRQQERRADAFALRLTGSSEAFSAAVRRLAARRLAEERPSALTRWFYHRHPSVAERLALADAFRKRSQVTTNH